MQVRLFPFHGVLAFLFAAAALPAADGPGRPVFVLTSTNASGNTVEVFRLDTSGTPELYPAYSLPTGGAGGASGNAGAVQFAGENGAVVNYGSNTVSQIMRTGDSFRIGPSIPLAPGCAQPVSVALADSHLFIVGANCAESHDWPGRSGVSGAVIPLTDNSAAQIAVGQTWAGITMKSGSVLQLPLTESGALTGTSRTVTLPASANNTPLGEAFWGDTLGFDPAHSPDSFALVNSSGAVFPVQGPQPPYPANAPCWLAKGPGNLWYAGNSPGQAISIFFSDGQGGAFYKSVPLPGVPTDVAVSGDGKWLATIYTAADGAHVAVFAIDAYGDLQPVATSGGIGVAQFNGVAFSQ